MQRRTGAVYIAPCDHLDVIVGQGTVDLELLDEIPDLDAIITPVGGEGLLSGVTIAAKSLRGTIRVFGAEPLGADDAARSKAVGVRLEQTAPKTIADGLRTSLGELTWPAIRDQVDGILTVEGAEIVSAMWLAWERAKLLIEPSAAVAVAAVLEDAFRGFPDLKRVAVVLSGGNVDLNKLPWKG